MSWTCSVCQTEYEYSEVHDSYYCPQCNEWMTKQCKNEDCEFCAHRPEKPL